MIIGYVRTSTADQVAGFEAQRRDLLAAGVDAPHLWGEKASAVGERPVLERLLASLAPGDVLVVTKIDRLARSVVHLGHLLERIHGAGASLRILNLGMDTATPTGKLMLNVLGAVAQFEREMMLERQREGVAKAKAEGRYKGRPPTFTDGEIAAAWSEGSAEVAARMLGVSVRHAWRLRLRTGWKPGRKRKLGPRMKNPAGTEV
jgi:DNA invertase Pin-like site-specific DNA recombinase